MKMLLTANGIQNKSIKLALESFMDKPYSDSKVVYIPTATTIEEGDHSWCVKDLNRLYDLNWKEFNILELNGISKDNITLRLLNADVIFVEGGNVYHLANSIITNGLAEIFEEIIKSKIYVGASAGSMIFSKAFNENSASLFDELPQLHELGISSISAPINLFEWYLKPHVNSPEFPERTDTWMRDKAEQADYPIYALDDETALKIHDNHIEIISEGTWKYYQNNK